MTKHEVFADEQPAVAKQLMLDGTIKTAQDDVGYPFRIDTSNVAIVLSWTCMSNGVMVSSVDDMKTVKIATNQVLHAGFNNMQLCTSLLISGLLACAFTISINGHVIPPLIVDIIPAMKQSKGSSSDDFCKENGDVTTETIVSLAMPRISYILKNYTKIFIEGADMLKGLLSCVRVEKHTLMTLEDDNILQLDPKYNVVHKAIGTDYFFKAFLIKHSENDRTIAVYHCAHIGSHITGVSE